MTYCQHWEGTALHGELAVDRRRWDESTAQLATLQTEQQDVTRQRLAFEARRMELDGLTVRIETLTDEQIEWTLVAKALGRDGLQTLEIDAAGPTVSNFTSELLSVCFRARFSVDLVTQEATADGKGLKESFQIKVYDNERGGHARDLGVGNRILSRVSSVLAQRIFRAQFRHSVAALLHRKG
ncbi:MAG: hypothetical protein NTV05_15775 [Acidobacteria bacterium]|nr:hypothetical protein [Acidobacteriota bacterium]